MEKIIPIPEEKCKQCRYWMPHIYEMDEDHISSEYGECRRFPPRAMGIEEGRFPITHEDSWCGEFDI